MGQPGMKNGKKWIRLEVRWDEELDQGVETLLAEKSIGLSALIEQALDLLHERYKRGRVDVYAASDFLNREDLDNKVTYQARFSEETYTTLRNLSYAFHIFMAECVRIALEWYVYVFYGKNEQERKIHQLKNYYSVKTPVPALIMVALFRNDEKRYYMTDHLPPFTCHFL